MKENREMGLGLLSKEDTADLLEKVKVVKDKIAANRDELRDLIYELEQIWDDADEAVDSMECAADSLSRLL